MKALISLALAAVIALGAVTAVSPAAAREPGGAWPDRFRVKVQSRGKILTVQDRRDWRVQDRRQRRPPAAQPIVPAPGNNRDGRTQRGARDAVKRGEIRSLEEVTSVVQRRYPGRLLDVQLQDNRGRPVYQLKMLTRDGRVLNVAVDARSAQILGVAGGR
ncbi:MAG: PepSY domain-containing protein [Alphaproteobacteria bacterium]